MLHISEIMSDIKAIDFNVSADDCFSQLKPHPKFNKCTFDNYKHDERYPSQLYLKNILSNITSGSKDTEKKRFRSLFRGSKTAKKHENLYIDGTYGVGKTHLLSACFNAFNGSKAFMSFLELTYFINYYGLENTIEKFKKLDLLLIDEFDLDDPANTRMAARLIEAVNDHTVIITTSNRPPDELGGGNFDTERFARELGIISGAFRTVIVEGVSFRINMAQWQAKFSESCFNDTLFSAKDEKKILTAGFDDLIEVLRSNHPFRFFVVPRNFKKLFIYDFRGFTKFDDALRFASFIDHCYYYDTKLFIKNSGESMADIFTEEMINSVFERRFLRCKSRLDEIAVFFTK